MTFPFPEMVNKLSAAFPRSNAPATAWGNIISNFLMLRNLRGFWPLTSIDENGDAYDLTGQGRVLTNANATPFMPYGLATYGDFTPASSQRLYRSDEVGTSITGKLTFGGWFWHDNFATGATQSLFGKYLSGGNQRSYWLYYDNALAVWRVTISSNGIATTSLSSTVTPFSGSWFFMVGKYNPSTEINLFVNGVFTSLVAGVPAACFDSTANLEIASISGGGAFLDGRAALCFLCADYIEDYIIKALYWHSAPLFGVKP